MGPVVVPRHRLVQKGRVFESDSDLRFHVGRSRVAVTCRLCSEHSRVYRVQLGDRPDMGMLERRLALALAFLSFFLCGAESKMNNGLSGSSSVVLPLGNSRLLLSGNGTARLEHSFGLPPLALFSEPPHRLSIATALGAALVVDMQEDFVPLELLVREGPSAPAEEQGLVSDLWEAISITNLASSSRLAVRHRNSSSSRSTVGDCEDSLLPPTAFEVDSPSSRALFFSGDARELLLDFSEHFSLTAPIFVEKELQGSEELLVVTSGAEDFKRTELHLPRLETFHFSGPPNGDVIFRGVPEWFDGSVTIIGEGLESVVLEETLALPQKSLTIRAREVEVRAALVQSCPVNFGAGVVTVAAPCTCAGFDDIAISSVTSLTVTSDGSISTVDGDITLDAATSIVLDGTLATTSGDVDLTAAGSVDVQAPITSNTGRLRVTSPAIRMDSTVTLSSAPALSPQLLFTADDTSATVSISGSIDVADDVVIIQRETVPSAVGIDISGSINCGNNLIIDSTGPTTGVALSGSADAEQLVTITATGALGAGVVVSGPLSSGSDMQVSVTGAPTGIDILPNGDVTVGGELVWDVMQSSTAIRLEADVTISGGGDSSITAQCDSGATPVGLELVNCLIDSQSNLAIDVTVDGGTQATGILSDDGDVVIVMQSDKNLEMIVTVGSVTPPSIGTGVRIISASSDIDVTLGTGKWSINSTVASGSTTDAVVLEGVTHDADTADVDIHGQAVTQGSTITSVSLTDVKFTSANQGNVVIQGERYSLDLLPTLTDYTQPLLSLSLFSFPYFLTVFSLSFAHTHTLSLPSPLLDSSSLLTNAKLPTQCPRPRV